MTKDERLELLEELYWVDWKELGELVPVEEVFNYLESKDLSIEEISQILKLYNNPGGDYVKEFSHIISQIYLRNRIIFFRALSLEKDEISNLVYLFRNERVFENEDIELEEIISENILDENQLDTAQRFFKAYKTVCST